MQQMSTECHDRGTDLEFAVEAVNACGVVGQAEHFDRTPCDMSRIAGYHPDARALARIENGTDRYLHPSLRRTFFIRYTDGDSGTERRMGKCALEYISRLIGTRQGICCARELSQLRGYGCLIGRTAWPRSRSRWPDAAFQAIGRWLRE